MRKFPCWITRIVDGDTVDVVVDLGFKIHHKVRVRFDGYDAPEVRTKDKAEKARGVAAQRRLQALVQAMQSEEAYVELISNDIGKYGRVIGDVVIDGHSLVDAMIGWDKSK